MALRRITIFGATGNQGSSVLNAVLADGTFTARAVTRDPSSAKALKLKERGVEVVQGDLWDKDSLVKAMSGSEAVFGVTNYDDPLIAHGDPKGEIQQGKNLIDAAKEAGVQFFVWSSLPSATKLSGGKLTNVHHFDNKAVVKDYLHASGLANATIEAGWFAECLWMFYPHSFVKTDIGYELPAPKFGPDTLQEITWAERDIGSSVLAILKNYQDRKDEILGKTFCAVTTRMTYTRFAEILSKAIGKPVKFTRVETTRNPEVDEMYELMSTTGCYPGQTVPDPRLVALGAKFSTLEEFAETSFKDHFLALMN